MEKTIEQSTTIWGTKTLITVFASVVIATNTFNAYIHEQENNALQIEYNKELSDKKDERVKQDAIDAIKKNNYLTEISRLTRELNECK